MNHPWPFKLGESNNRNPGYQLSSLNYAARSTLKYMQKMYEWRWLNAL